MLRAIASRYRLVLAVTAVSIQTPIPTATEVPITFIGATAYNPTKNFNLSTGLFTVDKDNMYYRVTGIVPYSGNATGRRFARAVAKGSATDPLTRSIGVNSGNSASMAVGINAIIGPLNKGETINLGARQESSVDLATSNSGLQFPSLTIEEIIPES